MSMHCLSFLLKLYVLPDQAPESLVLVFRYYSLLACSLAEIQIHYHEFWDLGQEIHKESELDYYNSNQAND